MKTLNTRPETLFLLCLGGTGLLSIIKVYLAASLDLYSDEVFYWMASTRLALAYSDLPFMTALLVWLGTAIEPGNTLAVRSLFLLMGSCLPILVYWLALPVTGRRNALRSALLTLCLPLGGFLGLLAVPDVPLLFFGLLTVGFFERALRTNTSHFWLLTGVALAAGLCTHYRFLLYPLAGVLFLLTFKAARQHWRNPRLWLAATIGAIGLLPVIWFNLTNQLSSASFYLVERHPWTFQTSGLLHLFKQAGIVTPPLYGLFVLTLWKMLQLARDGSQTAALLASVSLVNLLVYLVLAPWTDASSTSIHWPLSGYLPLLVYAPLTLEKAAHWMSLNWSASAARAVRFGVPGLGFLGTLVALLAIGSQAFQTPLQQLVGPGVLSNKMAGWREFASHSEKLLQREFAGNNPIIVTDNYYTAAQVKFAGLGDRVYTSDLDKAVRDGRRRQLENWEMVESHLPNHTGEALLFISEDSTLTLPDKESVLAGICRYASGLQQLDSLSLYGGDKQFSYFRADRLAGSRRDSDLVSQSCPYPARTWLDEPGPGSPSLNGSIAVTGWAYKEDIGIAAVHLLVDGERFEPISYGVSRPDVVSAMQVKSDPNAPALGFEHELDTRLLSNGNHSLAIELTDKRGVVSVHEQRGVYVTN